MALMMAAKQAKAAAISTVIARYLYVEQHTQWKEEKSSCSLYLGAPSFIG
jgi:phosphoribosylpyrophosphate synthetase